MAEYPAGFEPEQGGLHSFFGQLVDQGFSQRGAIAEFRAAGGRGGNDLLRQEYNFARDVAEAGEAGWGQPVDRAWSADAFIEWEAGTAGASAFPVSIHLRVEGGGVEVIPHMVMGDPGMTPEDVFAQAIDTYGMGMSATDTPLKGDITSVSMRGAPYVMVGRRVA